MPTFENGTSLATVRSRLNTAIIDAELGRGSITTVAGLIADTSMGYTTAAARYVTAGQRLTIAGFDYEVAASGASDHHVTTAGGVKLYVMAPRCIDALGALGDGTTDDSAAFTLANTIGGEWELRPAAIYRAANVSLTTDFLSFHCKGLCWITKNANGPIFSGTADFLRFTGIIFRGGTTASSGLTGHNLDLSGNNPIFTRCGSRWAAGRALKATGGAVKVWASSDIWQTDDATSAGYDIELGVSGTATLYHELHGVYSSQAFGGILATDTGSCMIVGGQFGKLNIKAGTSPSGVNGGITSNCRILGDVNVELSNAVFTGNQFSTVTITFAVGTSGHILGLDNNAASATIVNNGNANSIIARSTSAGSVQGWTYGPSAWTGQFSVDNVGKFSVPDQIVLQNNKSIVFKDSGGTEQNAIGFSTNDDWTFGANNGANFTSVASGSGGVFATVGGTTIAQFHSGGLRPQADDTFDLGTAAQRWNDAFAKQIRPGDGGPIWTSGSGTPEGVVTAPVGSLFTRTDGGAVTTLYVKETGSGNTGWVGK